jgi:hypothetical protein
MCWFSLCACVSGRAKLSSRHHGDDLCAIQLLCREEVEALRQCENISGALECRRDIFL